MEHYAASVADHLVDSLSFKLDPSASYIQSRRAVTFFPQGSNIYSAGGAGTRLVRINISSSMGQWLDASSVRLSFRLNNTNPTPGCVLRTISGPMGFFSRMRVIVGNGIIAEDIVDLNRTYNLFELLSSAGSKNNDNIEGFGHHWTDKINPYDISMKEWGRYGLNSMGGLNGGTSKRVCTRLLSGLLGGSNSKFIPLQFCPISVELELDQYQFANIIEPKTAIAPITAYIWDNTNTSSTFTIDDVVIHADIITLDSSLNNAYINHLANGNPIPITFGTYVSQSHVMTQTSQYNVNIIRSFSRLKCMFITFYADCPSTKTRIPQTGTTAARDNYLDQQGVYIVAADDSMNEILKPCNRFYHPMGQDEDQYGSTYEIQFQVSIGPETFPVYPVRSLSEAFYRLKQTIGILPSIYHSVNINYNQYKDCSFVCAIDFEKSIDASWTGINTKAGDLVSIKTTADNSIPAVKLPLKMFITLVSDNTLEIRESGVQIFD
jgi:hypothetical protein